MRIRDAPVDRGASPQEQKAYVAEKNVSWIRFVVIVFNVAAYWSSYYRRVGIPWLATAVSIIAIAYGILVLAAQPYRRFPILVTSAWTAASDGVLIVAWIHATGDFVSPFYLLWYLSLFAVTFRYDWQNTAISAGAYAVAYVVELAVTGILAGHGADVTVRVAYILLQGALGALFARESLRIVQDRFMMVQKVQEAERFRALADASPDALVIARDDVILEANDRAAELAGVPRESLLGSHGLAMVAAQSKETAQGWLQTRGNDPLELWITTSAGQERLVRVQSRTVQYQGGPARVTWIRDVTKERAADRLRDAAVRTEAELQRLRQMDDFKSRFINSAAHELNTPLTPVLLQLHLLKQRLPQEMEAERRSVDVVDRNMQRLARLVGDMLDVAKLESGRMRINAVEADLGGIVHEAADTFSDMAQLRDIQLSVTSNAPVPLLMDAKRVSQVVYNLVSNALKFTPAGGTVQVSAFATQAGGTVEVRDTGAGMKPAQIARLFQPFSRMHHDEIEASGTGLGLYISKGIIERHGGTIGCTSDGPGKGSVFSFTLPAKAVD